MCARYWPVSGSETYGHFTVEVTGEEKYMDYMVIKLSITNPKSQEVCYTGHVCMLI